MTTATAPRRSLKWIYDDVEFYPHQVDGVREMQKMTSFLLCDEMGLGKSLQAMTVFAIDVEQGLAKTVIVIVPASLKGNWAEEFAKFTRFRVMVLDGTKAKREKQLLEFAQSQETIEPYHVLIVNYEQLVNLTKKVKKGEPKPEPPPPGSTWLDKINAIGFDVAIYDEAHMLKNPFAERTKAAHGVVAYRYFMLTGSPMLNHVNELWSLLHRVNPDAFPDYYQFRGRYVVFGGYEGKQIVGVKNETELIARLRSVMIRRKKADVLDLPDKLYVPVNVDLLPEQRKVYNQIKKEKILVLPDDPSPKEIDNALAQFTYLKQAVGTLACFDGYDDISGKLDAVVERWLELYDNGHKAIVFTQFRDVQNALMERMIKATSGKDFKVTATPYLMNGDVKNQDRQPMVVRWREDRNPNPFVLMYQVGSVGLNLTASRHVLRPDKLYVPMLNEQAVDRAHRIGADQTQPVTIFDFIARNTVEQRIENILTTKEGLFGTVVDDEDFKRKLVLAIMEDEDY